MAVPKRKTSKTRTRRRKAQWLKTGRRVTLTECPHCHSKKLPHVICPECGYYAGKPVIVEKETKKEESTDNK